MSLPVVFLLGANIDLQEVFNRLEGYQEGLGEEFLTATDAYLFRLSIFPESAPIYVDTIRRQVIRKFPYSIFYKLYAKRILVMAILDLRQDRGNILKRLRS